MVLTIPAGSHMRAPTVVLVVSRDIQGRAATMVCIAFGDSRGCPPTIFPKFLNWGRLHL